MAKVRSHPEPNPLKRWLDTLDRKTQVLLNDEELDCYLSFIISGDVAGIIAFLSIIHPFRAQIDISDLLRAGCGVGSPAFNTGLNEKLRPHRELLAVIIEWECFSERFKGPDGARAFIRKHRQASTLMRRHLRACS